MGVDGRLMLIGRPHEKSWQENSLYQLQHEMFREHTEDAGKIYQTLGTIDQQVK